MSTDTVAVETTKKTAARVAEKVAETHILPSVVETAEVAVSLPSKFVVNGKVAAVLVVGSIALGAGGLYGIQKLREMRDRKKAEKVVPDTIADATVIEKTN